MFYVLLFRVAIPVAAGVGVFLLCEEAFGRHWSVAEWVIAILALPVSVAISSVAAFFIGLIIASIFSRR